MHHDHYQGVDPDIVDLAEARVRWLRATAVFNEADIDDLMQELILAALGALEGFEPNRGLKTTLVFGVMRRKATQLLRDRTRAKRDRRKESFSMDDTFFEEGEGECPNGERVADPATGDMDARDEALDLRLAIEALPPALRTLCELHSHLSPEDARRAAGMAKSTHHRAMQRIRAHLERHEFGTSQKKTGTSQGGNGKPSE